MTPRTLRSFLVALAASVVSLPVGAVDIVGDLDLLSAGTPPPNVMILLDNSTSMEDSLDGTPKIDTAGDAVKTLINNLYPASADPLGYTATVRMGLARFDVNSSNGAVIVEGVSDTNKAALINAVNATVTLTKAAGTPTTYTPLSEALVDIARYFAGQHGFGAYPAVGNTSPIDLTCRENFVVIVTDGEPRHDEQNHYGANVSGTPADATFWNLIGNADGDFNECAADASDLPAPDPTVCNDDPDGGRDDGNNYDSDGSDWLDDVAYFIARHDHVPDATLDDDQIIKTHTVGFAIDHPLLSETATNGMGDYLTAPNAADLATQLQEAFNNIFASIQASFTSAVVPGATIGLGNAFYNSYFRSSNSEPVWEGHLEALRISQTGEIQDSNLDPAVDPATGELLDTRVPFWDAADPLKSNTSRTIYTTEFTATATCATPPCRVAFDNTNVTAADLGLPVVPVYTDYPNNGGPVSTQAGLVDAIIGYVRGVDTFDSKDDDGDVTEMRDIVLGDIFHSTPRVIAQPTRFHLGEPGYFGFFDDYDDRDRVIYVGANDGMLHAFNAGQFNLGDDPSTPELEPQYYTPGDGGEIFGYVPGVQQDRLPLLPQNAPRTEYFVDGPISVADAWLGTGTKTKDEWATVMIVSYREGGTGYLALDITDPGATSTDDHFPYPGLLWEFTEADLGESWSEAVITRVKVRDALASGDKCGIPGDDGDCKEQWVAIFAGGYAADGDPNRPATYIAPGDAGWNTVSKAIYVVALDTGAVLAKVKYDASTNPDMAYSLPSAPAVIDLDFDGFADVVYVGDLGGQVWKWDISDVGEDTSAPVDGVVDNWASGVFFRTPSTTLTSGTEHYRSFFYPPVGAYVKGNLLLAFGSGERHNLAYEGDTDPGVVEENRFYVAKDPNPTGASAFTTTYDETNLTDVTALDADNVPGDLGYYFTLAESEKFVTEITVFAGFVIVGSYTPDVGADVCSTLAGQSFLHIFNLATSTGFFSDPSDPPSEDRRTYVGGGFPTSPEVTVANNPDDDVIIVKTSEGPRLISIDAPPRTQPKGTFIYWKQQD